MKLKDILALVSANEKITVCCVDTDGTPYQWTHFANNVPLIFWERAVEKLWSGPANYGLCIQIEN